MLKDAFKFGQCYIQDFTLISGAVANNPLKWDRYLRNIAGKATNVYSQHDEILKCLSTAHTGH